MRLSVKRKVSGIKAKTLKDRKNMTFEHRKKIYGYECDVYGHLNNANYLQVLESARSEALIEMDLPIAKLKEMGLQIFVIHFELDYLKAIDLEEWVTVKSRIMAMDRLKSTWAQEIYNGKGELCFRSSMIAVFASSGKATRISREMYAHFQSYAHSDPPNNNA